VRLVGAVALLLRRLRAERGVSALLFLVVALTSFVVAAGPRLYGRVADEGLRYEVGRGTSIQRNLRFTTTGDIPAGGDDSLGGIAARGEALLATLPASIRDVVDRTAFEVETPRFGLAGPPLFPTYVTLRQQSGLDGLVDLASGRWPERAASTPRSPDAAVVLEVAMSEATAAAIGVVLGDRLTASPDDATFGFDRFDWPAATIDIVVTGLFTTRDPSDDDWFDDLRLTDATLVRTESITIGYATALFASDAYADVLALGLPNRYRWNLGVDADRLVGGGVDTLAEDLRRVGTQYASAFAARSDGVVLRTGIGDAIARYLAQRATTDTALSLAAIGPLAVAAGAVGLFGILVVRRRRRALALARGRGASTSQLLAAQLWEGLLVTVPAALVGLGLAVVLVDGPATHLSSNGAILVALGATALLLLATWPAASRARRDLERDDPPVMRISPRRLVFETLVVGLSLAAVWLLRERGLAAVDAAGHPAGFDVFLAAAPLLAGVAVGLLLIRLYPVPIRGLGWFAARRRDLIPVLGLRSLGRHPTAGYLPLLILTLTVAIGTLSVVLASSLIGGQNVVSWQDVGADLRVGAPTDGSLDPGFDPLVVEGVEAAAAALVVPDAGLSTAPGKRSSAFLEAIQSTSYDAVVADSPVATSLASSFTGAPTGQDAGTTDHPIPAIVSKWSGPAAPVLEPGDRFALAFRGRTMSFRVVEQRDTFPGISAGSAFVVVPIDSIEQGWRGSPLHPTTWFIRGSATVGQRLGDALAATSGGTVLSRYELFAGMRDAPLVAAVIGGFALAVGLAVAYSALAVVTVVALEAQRRSREVAFLRTLGMSDRQLGQLTILEQGVPLVAALLIGVAGGLGLAWLIAPGIDLAAFSRSGAVSGLEIDWVVIGAVTLTILAVTAAAVATSSLVARRVDVGPALRIGDE
jgi:putative ABC transport system permease protein